MENIVLSNRDKTFQTLILREVEKLIKRMNEKIVTDISLLQIQEQKHLILIKNNQ